MKILVDSDLIIDVLRDFKPSVDCIIAATAFKINAVLATRNLRDFKKVKEIRVLKTNL